MNHEHREFWNSVRANLPPGKQLRAVEVLEPALKPMEIMYHEGMPDTIYMGAMAFKALLDECAKQNVRPRIELVPHPSKVN